ncbi:RHS repeat-associated core domain-containing protein, partial [Enterococcus moraviensis]
NPLGEVTTIKYDEQNHPIYMKQPNDGEYTFTYENGNLLKVENPLSYSSETTYDEQHRPVSVKQPDGSLMCFTYDERGNLASIQYPNQGTTHYVYDNQNQVIETTNPTGAVTKFEYNTEGNLTKVTNDEGNTREYTYNDINKVTAVKDFDGTTVTQKYNELGKVSAITNPSGHVTEMTYDLMWNISNIKEPNGAETAYLYNQYNQLSQVVNAKGYSVHYDYDENQNVTSIRSPKGEETTFTYDALNRRTKMVEADGATTRYTYTKLGKVATITDALNHTTTFEYDLLGQLVRQTDALDNELTLSYTSLGQLEAVTDANGGITSYEYYPGGNLKQVTYPAGETEQYVYDLNDNVIEKWTGEESKITYTYDILDRVTAITNPLGNSRKFSYDAADRIVLYQDETGAITEYDYSPTGNLTLVKDALGNETHYDYDTVGNLTTIQQYGLIDAELEKVSEQNRVTQYQYDLLGNVTSVTDALGNQEQYGYDENNQLIKKTDKDGYQTVLDYNQTGQVQKLNYSDGKEVIMQYNPLRKLEAVKDWLGTTQMKLDALGRVEEVLTPDQQITKYSWDGQNNRTKLVYPDGKEVQYIYNPSNKLTELHTGDQVYRYHYDAQGRLIEKSLPNQVTTHYDYTPASQLSALIHQKEQEILEKYQYQYDEAGNKQVIKKQRRGLTEDSGHYQYQYDALQRLTHVSKDQEVLRQYTYDAFGNRTSKQEATGSTTYQYNALNQLIKQNTPQETKQFNYDQRGNLVEELINNQVTKSFTFDATNMMTQVTTASGDKATYQYNGLRNRTGQTIEKNNEPLKQIQYILDLTKPYNNLLERKVNEDKEQYLWDNDLLAKNEEEYFLLDDLGSPLRQLTTTRQTMEEYGFDEFGQALFNTPTNQPFGFTGYQQDEVSGLNYAQARYYDQNQGRFVSEDGIKGVLTSPMTLNPYTYVWNSPLDLVDKDGYFPSLGDIGKGISDFWNNNIHGKSNTIEETLPDGTKHVTSESSGGGILVETSKISIDPITGKKSVNAGVQVNIPIDISIPTPWGKIGWSNKSSISVDSSGLSSLKATQDQKASFTDKQGNTSDIHRNITISKDPSVTLGAGTKSSDGNLNVSDFGFDKNGWTGTGTTGKSKGRMTDKLVKSISSKTWKELFEYAKVPAKVLGAVALTALMAYLIANDATIIGILDDALIGPVGAALSKLLLQLGEAFGKNPRFASAMSCSLA